jgi:hypothetical protein
VVAGLAGAQGGHLLRVQLVQRRDDEIGAGVARREAAGAEGVGVADGRAGAGTSTTMRALELQERVRVRRD